MRGVAVGEAALDAGVAAVGLAVFPGHHAHDFFAAHFSLERAANAAIGAGRDGGMLGLADFDQRFFGERRGRAGLHAGAARDAFRIQELFVHAGRNAAVEATAGNRQRERALNFFAGADAAIADDALGRVVGEVGVGLVLRQKQRVFRPATGEDMVFALVAVANIAQADGTSHILQFAIAVGRAGQAVERMVGDVEFHHALADAASGAASGF